MVFKLKALTTTATTKTPQYCSCFDQTTEDMLSESPRCNDMVADLHFPRVFGTPIQCEIARRFPRSVVKVRLNVQCKNISILSGVQP